MSPPGSTWATYSLGFRSFYFFSFYTATSHAVLFNECTANFTSFNLEILSYVSNDVFFLSVLALNLEKELFFGGFNL